MTKRLALTGAGKSASHAEARNLGVSMSEIVWNLSGTDKQCASNGPGHWVHWIHHKLSVQDPEPGIPVSASVDADGIVLIEGADLSLVSWNHRPELVRAALRRSRGFARWKPRWHLLVVPTGDRIDGASNVFSLVAAYERRECGVTRSTYPEYLVPNKPSPTNLPPLRVAARYTAGRPRPRRSERR